jgi:hypothetical protein
MAYQPIGEFQQGTIAGGQAPAMARPAVVRPPMATPPMATPPQPTPPQPAVAGAGEMNASPPAAQSAMAQRRAAMMNPQPALRGGGWRPDIA